MKTAQHSPAGDRSFDREATVATGSVASFGGVTHTAPPRQWFDASDNLFMTVMRLDYQPTEHEVSLSAR